MRVLVACEFSGRIRDAFISRGHNAVSSDFLPTEIPGPHHQGDARDLLKDGWDLLIAHPPCTRLCNSGVRWLKEPPKNVPAEALPIEKIEWSSMSREERLELIWILLDRGASLFQDFWDAPIDKIAIENPIMHKYARERLSADIPRPQIVQPWWFGEPEKKATGWTLKNLPKLRPTEILKVPRPGSLESRSWEKVFRAGPSPLRWKDRSRTLVGPAKAIAEQWG